MYKFINRLSTETKFHFNQFIAQLGFISIAIVGYQYHDSLNTLIVLNIVFAILFIVINHMFIKSAKQRAIRFKRYFDSFLKFVSFEVNTFKPAKIYGNDEIADMLTMLNQTAKRYDVKLKEDMKVLGEIVLVADKLEQGMYGFTIVSDTQNPMIKTLRNTLNHMLHITNKNIEALSTIVKSYTSNDFTKRVQIESKLKAQMRILMEGVNQLGDTLSQNAKHNLENGQTLEKNAITMTQSVTNLANKANQQAVSLEETTASVEEITTITRNNTQNSSTMSELGNAVKMEVSTGMNLANKTSESMDEINIQVLAINKAIEVMDQIAFQTNILSLNAAVEAATTGEAGKGFAVVAQEVRNLASRSSSAANEIKLIVEQAAIKANEGKKVSDEMIMGYKSLIKNFNETMQLIENVSSSSKEQMVKIEQINNTVVKLDKVTQENASEANNIATIANNVTKMANDLVADAQMKKV